MNQQILLNGQWQPSQGQKSFRAMNPATRQPLDEDYPVSPWSEVDAALTAAAAAFETVRDWPGERFAAFLDAFAAGIEANAAAIVAMANLETGLPVEPRLKNVELPRTVSQLRQAAAAAREGSWALATIDVKPNIRSVFGSIGPVAVFGPNNFPCAFNSIAGGDFAAAVAAGNPVLAKGHSSHPATTRLFAEAAQAAAEATGMPPGFVQLIYRTSHEDGARLVSDARIAATGYTGSRSAGLVLKEAADKAGKPIYLELSSINPVYILPGALDERLEGIADEFSASSLMGAGQFCTNPGLVLLLAGRTTDAFIDAVGARFAKARPGTLLSAAVEQSLRAGIDTLRKAGASVVSSSEAEDAGSRCCHPNTLLLADGQAFLNHPHELQAEAFGNAALFVVATDIDQLLAITRCLEGNLTGCLYTHTTGKDDALYDRIEPELRQRVGRLLNDKMPTGVAVSPAMNHGGPYPATGHSGFTAVGIPASLRRFAMLQCYDGVRSARLPPLLQDQNTTGAWRLIDGAWTQASIA
ncbi:MAG: aldehyde dehydrogenase family protein [Planctomycetaceae bacterium]|nr:aldehyde dehydrogenase family protein [Planctomycetaceae bacterium]